MFRWALRLVAIAALVITGLTQASPAFGASGGFVVPAHPTTRTPVQPMTSDLPLHIRIEPSAWGSDRIEISGTGDPVSFYGIARRIGDAFGVSRHASSVGTEESTSPVSSSLLTEVLDVGGHLAKKSNDGYLLTVPSTEIDRMAKQYGFATVDIDICSRGIASTDRSHPLANDVVGGCRVWRDIKVGSPMQITVLEKPDISGYWQLFAIVVVTCLVLTAAAYGVAVWLRRKWLSELDSTTLTSIFLCATVGWIAVGVASFVFYAMDSPFGAAGVLGGGSTSLHVGLVTLTAVPLAAPFVAAAIALSGARARGPIIPGGVDGGFSLSDSAVLPWAQDDDVRRTSDPIEETSEYQSEAKHEESATDAGQSQSDDWSAPG